jgi:phage N-6-adenine-methyltransferase
VSESRKKCAANRHLGPLFSSRSNEWATPQDFYDILDAQFAFTLDPCAAADNAKCSRFFTKLDDGLSQPWDGSVFMNPPYSCVKPWMAKAVDESRRGSLVVALVPARTCTAWWHDNVMTHAAEVRAVRGRLRFGAGRGAAPFPSAVVVFRPGVEGPPDFATMLRPTPPRTACTRKRSARR